MNCAGLTHDEPNCRYNGNPTQDNLTSAISISRRWSIPNLYDYALDHFKRQFQDGRIHPAVVLGVAREYGIAELVEPAVKALAKPTISFASWSTDPDILRHTTVEDVGTIGRMKEKLLHARFALCKAPPAVHDDTVCHPKDRSECSMSWRDFWDSSVIPRLVELDGEIGNQLWWIRSDRISKSRIQRMTRECADRTVREVIGKACWSAETKIPEGAVRALEVLERTMLRTDELGEVVSMS